MLSLRAAGAVSIVGIICFGLAFGRPFAHADGALLAGESRRALVSSEVNRSTQTDGRCIGCQHDERVLERWAWKYYPDSYAGMYFALGKVNRLVIGFTEQQSSRVHAARRLPGLLGGLRVSGFPYVPKHSLSELDELQQRILDDVLGNEAHPGLIISVGVAVQVNLVEVGADRRHVQKARRVLKRLYGPDAPIRVRYEEPPVEV